MNLHIIFGTKRENIIQELKKSWLAKVLLLGMWIWLYQKLNMFEISDLKLYLIIALAGLLILNFLYVPVRILKYGSAKCKRIICSIIVILILLMGIRRLIPDALIFTLEQNFIHICALFCTCFFYIIVAKHFKGFHNRKNHKSICSQDFEKMEGHEFEYYCADLLRQNGFQKVEVTQGSGDFGIDVLAYDRKGIKYGIQCKRYSGSVGWHAVEEASAGSRYYKCDRAVVLTNSNFTRQAVEGAGAIGVLLWDGNWIREKVG